jgi:hypothetical protein
VTLYNTTDILEATAMKPKAVPSIVTVMGWVVFALGIMTALGSLFGLTVMPAFFRFQTQMMQSLPGPRPAVIDFSQMPFVQYRYAFYLPMLVFAAVQIWAGYGLTQGREPARRTLVVLAILLMGWQVAGPFMILPMLHQMQAQMLSQMPGSAGNAAAMEGMMRGMMAGQMVIVVFITLAWIVALGFFIRWLGSPAVREACRAETVLPPPPLGGKP